MDDAFQVESDGSALTWHLTGSTATPRRARRPAAARSRSRSGSSPPTTPVCSASGSTVTSQAARRQSATGTRRGRSPSPRAAHRGRVGRRGTGTQLGDYTIEIVCRRGDTVVATAGGPSVEVNVGRGDAIVCVITNTAKPQADQVRPALECVLFKDGSPDVAYWGYLNTGRDAVTVRAGTAQNSFTPAPAVRGQPDVFEPGRVAGVFQTPFQAGSTTLVWTLTGQTAAASRAPRLQPDGRAEEGHDSRRRPGRLPAQDQRGGRGDGRQRDDERPTPDRDR